MNENKKKKADQQALNIAERNSVKIISNADLVNENRQGAEKVNGFSHSLIKDVICFSHLRWDFVFQRPQHLLSRWARDHRVFFFEEPVRGRFDNNFLKTVYSNTFPGLMVITPHVSDEYSEEDVNNFLRHQVNELVRWYGIKDYLSWYLTPMAVQFTNNLNPKVVVYDSMDELSAFRGAHPMMLANEEILLKMADVVFTGGYSLYEYKKKRHTNIHAFPSSIDQRHFESGIGKPDPSDQETIPHPRIGFFGVIDERLDIELLDQLAKALPGYNFIMIGPVVKIDPATLPGHSNIYYLGQKHYSELPVYLANWDIAFLPFAKNESTRFISPTKTPEYLCARKPVISTSIRDVIIPYGEAGIVQIADNVEEFASAIERAIKQKDNKSWHARVRLQLRGNSWDHTWTGMREIILHTLERKEKARKDLPFMNTNSARLPTGSD